MNYTKTYIEKLERKAEVENEKDRKRERQFDKCKR